MRREGLAMIVALALGPGCTPEPELPDLEQIYRTVSEAGAPRPLITLPGTLGSRLVDSESGTVVWGGGSRGISADPETPREARLIALPILTPDRPLSELEDGVEPAGILDTARAEVLGVPIDIEVYGGVLRMLTAGGFRAAPAERRRPVAGGPDSDDSLSTVPGTAGEPDPDATPLTGGPAPSFEQYRRLNETPANAFRFDYDWRRDLPSLAQAFHRFVMRRKREVAALRSLSAGRVVTPEEVRFDLLAHSMGGLVARYYLMHGPADLPETGPLPPVTWAGAAHFSRVVIVAAPNAGSILAMDNLINGKELGPLQPVFPPTLLATHAAPWQLFPRARHERVTAVDGTPLDPLDPELWERHGWGLLDTEGAELRAWLMPEIADPERRRARASAHQARLMRRARRVQRALDRWAPKPDHLEMFLVVGGGFATPASAVVTEEGAFRIAGHEEGDGVVLRASVLLDERQGGETGGGLETPLRFDTTLFLPDEHVELTKNPVFGDNLLFWLLEQPREREALAEPDAPDMLRSRDVRAGPGDAAPRAPRARDR